jgi:hypothetical protein
VIPVRFGVTGVFSMNYQAQPQSPRPPSPNIVLAVVSVGFAVVGLVFMIPTLLFTLCGIVPIACGLAALVVGVLAKVRANKDPNTWGGGGLAIGGIIAGILCVIAPVVYVILVSVLWYTLSK